MPTLPKKLTSTFALVEIKTGRQQLAKLVGQSYAIPFTITGTIQPGAGGVGHDDGVGIEFACDVDSLTFGEPKLSPCDKLGRPWALVGDLKAGDRVECDGDFTCMKNHSKHTVKADDEGDLYISCKDGKHMLDGQKGERGEYIGLYKLS